MSAAVYAAYRQAPPSGGRRRGPPAVRAVSGGRDRRRAPRDRPQDGEARRPPPRGDLRGSRRRVSLFFSKSRPRGGSILCRIAAASPDAKLCKRGSNIDIGPGFSILRRYGPITCLTHIPIRNRHSLVSFLRRIELVSTTNCPSGIISKNNSKRRCIRRSHRFRRNRSRYATTPDA